MTLITVGTCWRRRWRELQTLDFEPDSSVSSVFAVLFFLSADFLLSDALEVAFEDFLAMTLRMTDSGGLQDEER